MFKLVKPVFLMCETPLHAGSGSELGIVDLPIQRERHTDFPKIEGSSLKGGIREAFEEPADLNKPLQIGTKPMASSSLKAVTAGTKPGSPEYRNAIHGDYYQDAIELTFGPENAGNDAHAGALGFTDARLLLFPVKSMKGVFAWITCPKALQQFRNDLKLCQERQEKTLPLNWSVPGEKTAPKDCQLFVRGDKIVLEEYTFEITADQNATDMCSELAKWLSEHLFPKTDGRNDPYAFWREKLKTDLVVLANDDFRDFVTLSTEVITRTKINNDTGTVQPGALFTEEYLPSESVLYALALASPIFKEKTSEKGVFNQNGIPEEKLVMDFFSHGLPNVLQLGGDATIGKGIVRNNIPKEG